MKDETSQEELATAIGVSRQTVHAIEKGKAAPSTLLAFKIARHFNRRVEDVFYLENISPPSNAITPQRFNGPTPQHHNPTITRSQDPIIPRSNDLFHQDT